MIIVKQWTIPWIANADDRFHMDNVTPKQYDGYKFVCWINFTSNGNVVPLYTNDSTGTNVKVFCYDPEKMTNNKVDCVAMYIKV